jgi:hypothetical protein
VLTFVWRRRRGFHGHLPLSKDALKFEEFYLRLYEECRNFLMIVIDLQQPDLKKVDWVA